MIKRRWAMMGASVVVAGVVVGQTISERGAGKPLPYGHDYFKMRDGLQNCRIVFERAQQARVVFMGGSITASDAWCKLVRTDLTNRFPKTQFDFINAGIGSMGSTPHAFRFTRDVLKNGKVDLFFIEAAVNDEANGMSALEMLRGMEGVVRHARRSNPAMDIVMLHFVDEDKMAVFNAGRVPTVIEQHEKVAEHYGLPSIDLAREVTERIRAGQFTWKDDFKGLHPSPFGHVLYAQAIGRLFDAAWKSPLPEAVAITPCRQPIQPLDAKSYASGNLMSVEHAKIDTGWTQMPNWTPVETPGRKIGTRAGFVHVPALVSEKPGSTFTLTFKGTGIGLFIAAGPDAGRIEYSIDGGAFQARDLFTRWSPALHLPWAVMLDAELDQGQHELALRVSQQTNAKSTGHAVRIMHFLVNE